MEENKDPTEVSGQVDVLPGSPDPLPNADQTARIARFVRGRRPLSDAERQQRQVAMTCNALDFEDAGMGCAQVLHLSIFFDGTGNNRDEEMAKSADRRALSNIAKMFFTHVERRKNVDYPYISGVGTPCPEIGDKGGYKGLAFGKGGGERVEYALQRLDKLIDEQEVKKILNISVSVFGFSRGSAQARAFVRDLAAKCQRQSDGTWHYRDIPLRIGFLGVFDTVCSVWSGMATALFNAKDGHGQWAYDMKLPPIVEQCVHLTAAHELRPQFPLDSTRDNAHYPSNTVEIWYPGVHSDVGGGYDPAHQGRRNSISRFALNEMFDMARAAGVLLRPVDELDPEIQDEFDKDDADLREAYNGYLQQVHLKQGRLEDVQAAHMELLHRWLKERVDEGDDNDAIQRLRAREKALKDELRTLRAQQRRIPDPYADSYTPITPEQHAQWNELYEQIRDRRSQLSDVRKQRNGLLRESNVLERRMVQLRRKREQGKKLNLRERTMLAAWDNPEPVPEAVRKFFNDYGHDSVSHWFTGDLARWRTIYFGDAKYKPESVPPGELEIGEPEMIGVLS